MKLYCNFDASRPVPAAGKQIMFAAAEYMSPTHSWWGIYSTEDEAEIADLDALATAGKIEELNEIQYDALDQKKSQLRPGWPHFNLSLPNLQQSVPAQKAVDPAAEAPVKPAAEALEEIISPRKAKKK